MTKQSRNEEEEERNIQKVLLPQWKRHLKLSKLAIRRKIEIVFARRLSLGLLFTGASCQTICNQLSSSRSGSLVALLGSGLIAAAPVLTKKCLSKEVNEKWAQCRCAANDLEHEIFMFRAGIDPYDDEYALEELAKRGEEIMNNIKDTSYESIKIDKEEMALFPPKLDLESYIELRVDPTIKTYHKQAKKKQKLSNFYKTLRGWFLGLSSLFGLVSSANKGKTKGGLDGTILANVGPWATVMTTMAGATGAHIEAWRLDDLSSEALQAARDLENLKVLPQDFETFVRECEGVIAEKTKNWVSLKRNKKKAGDGAGANMYNKLYWNPHVLCEDSKSGTMSASERVKNLMQNESLSEKDAIKKVMRQYPNMFVYDTKTLIGIPNSK